MVRETTHQKGGKSNETMMIGANSGNAAEDGKKMKIERREFTNEPASNGQVKRRKHCKKMREAGRFGASKSFA